MLTDGPHFRTHTTFCSWLVSKILIDCPCPVAMSRGCSVQNRIIYCVCCLLFPLSLSCRVQMILAGEDSHFATVMQSRYAAEFSHFFGESIPFDMLLWSVSTPSVRTLRTCMHYFCFSECNPVQLCSIRAYMIISLLFYFSYGFFWYCFINIRYMSCLTLYFLFI